MLKSIRLFRRNEKGATAIEYALLAALIAIAAIAAMRTLGTSISGQFTKVGTTISTGN